MKYNPILLVVTVIVSLITACNSSHKTIQNRPQNNTKQEEKDTITILSTKFCFPEENLCIDSFYHAIMRLPDNVNVEDDPSPFFVTKKSVTNIYPIDINASDSSLIKRTLELLDILNSIREQVINGHLSDNYLFASPLYTKYFFKLNNGSRAVVSDTISYISNYDFHPHPTKLYAQLQLNTLKNCNLNTLKLKYESYTKDGIFTHHYWSDNKYCKNFIFDLKLSTRDEILFNNAPIFGNLRGYLFPDER